MFKISGNNFNDQFRQLKMVLRVERKLFVIEQPISPAPPIDSEYLRSGMRKRSKLDLPVLQGFRIERKLKRGALYLYMGNRVREQVEAIGSYNLHLPNGLVIYLDNCHYAPTITRGVVSVSRLVDNGFVQCFTDYGISISMNNVV
ncbi:hypothetical protein Tco_1205188, partial [Tanacetum coccineum]